MDWRMTEIRAQQSLVPVVLMTARADDNSDFHAKQEKPHFRFFMSGKRLPRHS